MKTLHYYCDELYDTTHPLFDDDSLTDEALAVRTLLGVTEAPTLRIDLPLALKTGSIQPRQRSNREGRAMHLRYVQDMRQQRSWIKSALDYTELLAV